MVHYEFSAYIFHVTSCNFTIQFAPRNKDANTLLLLLLLSLSLLLHFLSALKKAVLRIKAL